MSFTCCLQFVNLLLTIVVILVHRKLVLIFSFNRLVSDVFELHFLCLFLLIFAWRINDRDCELVICALHQIARLTFDCFAVVIVAESVAKLSQFSGLTEKRESFVDVLESLLVAAPR